MGLIKHREVAVTPFIMKHTASAAMFTNEIEEDEIRITEQEDESGLSKLRLLNL